MTATATSSRSIRGPESISGTTSWDPRCGRLRERPTCSTADSICWSRRAARSPRLRCQRNKAGGAGRAGRAGGTGCEARAYLPARPARPALPALESIITYQRSIISALFASALLASALAAGGLWWNFRPTPPVKLRSDWTARALVLAGDGHRGNARWRGGRRSLLGSFRHCRRSRRHHLCRRRRSDTAHPQNLRQAAFPR